MTSKHRTSCIQRIARSIGLGARCALLSITFIAHVCVPVESDAQEDADVFSDQPGESFGVGGSGFSESDDDSVGGDDTDDSTGGSSEESDLAPVASTGSTFWLLSTKPGDFDWRI